jgi:predicted Zn-dependent protease
MNLCEKMQIILLPCLSEHQRQLIDMAVKEVRFNQELYERIRIARDERKKNQNDETREIGIRFIYDKNTQSIQAYEVDI